MRAVQPSISCCDVVATFIVGVWKLFINLCPVVAQFMALHTLCNHERYLDTATVDKTTRFWSHVCLLLNGYVILYVVGYVVWWVAEHVDCKESAWRRHLAQTLATLFVGKLWYELMRLGSYLVYGSAWNRDDETCDPSDPFTWLLGLAILTACTCGLFLPFYYVHLCSKHWDNVAQPWKRECAHLAAGVIVFTLWSRWFHAAVGWWEQPLNGVCVRFAGFVSLSITTLGLWTAYMIVFYTLRTWWSALVFAQAAVYEHTLDDAEFDLGRWLLGHIVFVVATGGLFIVYRAIEGVMRSIAWIPANWNSEIRWRREAARWIGGLGAVTLWIRMYECGRDWVYPHAGADAPMPPAWWQRLAGHVLLALTTMGLYAVLRFGQLWIHLFELGQAWVYHQEGGENQDHVPTRTYLPKQVAGHVLLTITTLGLFVVFRVIELYIRFVAHGWALFGRTVDLRRTTQPVLTCDQWCGLVYLALATGVVPFLLCLGIGWVLANWCNHDEPWRRHVAQTVGLFVVGKLWWEALCACLSRRYNDQGKNDTWWTRPTLVVLTGGLYILSLLEEFISSMYQNLQQAPNSRACRVGLLQASFLTAGIAGLWAGRMHKERSVRVFCHTILTGYNATLVWVLLSPVGADVCGGNATCTSIVVIVLVALSYPIMGCAHVLLYCEPVRSVAAAVANACILAWRVCNHACDHMAQLARFVCIRAANTCLVAHARRKTWWSQVSCNFANDTYARIVLGEPVARQPGMPGYEAPQQFDAILHQLNPVRTFAEKQQDRQREEEAAIQIAYVHHVLTCIEARLWCDFATVYEYRASLHHRFWNRRFERLEMERLILPDPPVVSVRMAVEAFPPPLSLLPHAADFDIAKREFGYLLSRLEQSRASPMLLRQTLQRGSQQQQPSVVAHLPSYQQQDAQYEQINMGDVSSVRIHIEEEDDRVSC